MATKFASSKSIGLYRVGCSAETLSEIHAKTALTLLQLVDILNTTFSFNTERAADIH